MLLGEGAGLAKGAWLTMWAWSRQMGVAFKGRGLRHHLTPLCAQGVLGGFGGRVELKKRGRSLCWGEGGGATQKPRPPAGVRPRPGGPRPPPGVPPPRLSAHRCAHHPLLLLAHWRRRHRQGRAGWGGRRHVLGSFVRIWGHSLGFGVIRWVLGSFVGFLG